MVLYIFYFIYFSFEYIYMWYICKCMYDYFYVNICVYMGVNMKNEYMYLEIKVNNRCFFLLFFILVMKKGFFN